MEDFKELVYFALSLIAAVLVITLVTVFGTLTSQMAEARHADIYAKEQIITARKYGEYDGQTLCGIEVIALLRENVVNRAECTINLYLTPDSPPVVMDISNFNNFTYEALTEKISPIRIEPNAMFNTSVNTDHTEITIIRI